MIRAVIFDVGFTLVRIEPPEEVLVLEAMRAAGLEVASSDLARAAQAVLAAERAKTPRDLDVWASDLNIRRYWLDLYERMLGELDVAPQYRPATAERIYAQFVGHAHWTLYPEVEGVLGELQRRGYILGAVSDWQSALVELVHHLNLSRFLQFIVVSAVIGLGKPDPLLFRHAIARAGVAPAEALFIGDTYATDILGARAVGMHPVLIARNHEGFAADVPVIRSLDEIIALLPSYGQ
ncbi:MAG TPA: HAD-IA family hydrolase [Ardenticatenaceae bacterium]|nr:HAD-IA family hydrolase [Ardenticatenaceae bacterium]